MVFTHYYKIKVYVNNGWERYNTLKYVFADNEEKAIEEVCSHYICQGDLCKILEVYEYPIQNTMMFENLITT